jgi:hypothetical protein
MAAAIGHLWSAGSKPGAQEICQARLSAFRRWSRRTSGNQVPGWRLRTRLCRPPVIGR